MAGDFFTDVTGPIEFGGLGSTDPLTYKVYEPDRLVLGKRMADHLRPGVCFWHSFAWPGTDMFGMGTLDRPWLTDSDDAMAAARLKMAAAFEFFTKIGIPFYCFHDRDVAPEGDRFAELPGQPRRAGGRCRPGTRSRPASACCGGRRTCSATPATRPGRPRTPTRRSSPTRPRRSSTCSR